MKTMEINELVSELKEYDGELTVKVWNNGADKAYPISHVGQGHTDGVLANILNQFNNKIYGNNNTTSEVQLYVVQRGTVIKWEWLQMW